MKIIQFVLIILFFSYSASSQATSSTAQNEVYTEKNEFNISAGGSLYSSTVIGSTKNVRFGAIALRYARIFKPGRAVALKYTVDVTPVNVLSYPFVRLENQGGNNFVLRQTRVNRYGFGVAPLGIQVNFRRKNKVQPFVTSSGGFIYFKDRIPDETGARFNFTADAGGGVQFMLRDKKAVAFGYKYQHISNGYRAQSNPGFDSNIFYMGFSVFRWTIAEQIAERAGAGSYFPQRQQNIKGLMAVFAIGDSGVSDTTIDHYINHASDELIMFPNREMNI